MAPPTNELIYFNDKIASYDSFFKMGYRFPIFTTTKEHMNVEVFALPRIPVLTGMKKKDISDGLKFIKEALGDKASLLDIDFNTFVLKRAFGEAADCVFFLPVAELTTRNISNKINSFTSYAPRFNRWYIEPFCKHALKEHRFHIVNGKILYCTYSYHERRGEELVTLDKFIDVNELILNNPEEMPSLPNPFASVVQITPTLREIVDTSILHLYNNYIHVKHNTLPSSNFFLRVDVSIVYHLNYFGLLFKEFESINSAYSLIADNVGEVDHSKTSFNNIVETLANMYKNLIFQNTCLNQSLAVPQMRMIRTRAKDPDNLIKRKKVKKIVIH